MFRSINELWTKLKKWGLYKSERRRSALSLRVTINYIAMHQRTKCNYPIYIYIYVACEILFHSSIPLVALTSTSTLTLTSTSTFFIINVKVKVVTSSINGRCNSYMVS